MVALHVEDDGQLLVASNAGRETMAVYRYDPRSGKRGELLAAHDVYDIGATADGSPLDSLLLDPTGRKALGFQVETAPPSRIWLDARHRRLQEMLDGAMPGMHNEMQHARTGSRIVVSSWSDRKPQRWHVLDTRSGELRPLFPARPWLDDGRLAAMRPVTIRTRDGMQLPSFLLEPPQRRPGSPLPAVLLVHGGPWTPAEGWGLRNSDYTQAQLLVAQGYAVLLPNFRGTTGLGRTVYQSARGQFGLKMQEDLEDATDWLVREGIADAGRVCLMGASYGGYAALMGAIKTPEKYRCAVAGMPVTDIPLLLTSGWSTISRDELPRRYWLEMVGDPATQEPALAQVSPARQVARIKAPVLLYGSVDDRRVPIEQMERMREGLRAAGQDPVWLVKFGEGHGFGDSDNLVEVLRAQFEFLRKHLGAH